MSQNKAGSPSDFSDRFLETLRLAYLVLKQHGDDVLACGTTNKWNSNSRALNAGASMDDANLNRRQTTRVGPAMAYAHGIDRP